MFCTLVYSCVLLCTLTSQVREAYRSRAKTVVRWENSSVFQNRTADTLMRVIRNFPEVAERLMERVDETPKP